VLSRGVHAGVCGNVTSRGLNHRGLFVSSLWPGVLFALCHGSSTVVVVSVQVMTAGFVCESKTPAGTDY
jgi:hypothetical protein